MTDSQKRAAKWLRASRPDTVTQDALAADIERVTGWHITRDRYSKYESGNLPMGKVVLGRFVDYWATKGKPGPGEESTATPPTSSDGGGVAGELMDKIDALVGSVNDLIGELRAARAERDAAVEELQARVRALEAWRAIPDRSAGEGSGALSAPQG